MDVTCLLGLGSRLCVLLEHSSFSSPAGSLALAELSGPCQLGAWGGVCPSTVGKLESEQRRARGRHIIWRPRKWRELSGSL